MAFGLPVVLLVGLLAAVIALPSRREFGAALLVVVCAFDMVVFASTAPWRTDQRPVAEVEEFYSDAPAAIGPPADAAGGVDRWVTQTGVPRGVALADEYPSINGYDPIIQADFAATVAAMDGAGALNRADFLVPGWLGDVLRVTTLIMKGTVPPSDPMWQRETYIGRGVWRWTRTPRLDEAELVGDVRLAALTDIRRAFVKPDADFTRTAYVESAEGMLPAGTAPADPDTAGTVLSGAMGRYGSGRFEVDAARPALLVISSAWLEGWHATVDGRSVPVVRANGVVLGVVVPPGRHTVLLRFVPPGLRLGAVISALSLVALFTPSAALAWRRRRSRG